MYDKLNLDLNLLIRNRFLPLFTKMNPNHTTALQNSPGSEKEIWNALRENDKRAFAEIYHQFFDILLQTGLHLSCDRELVKDCIHDLFLEIWINKINLASPLSIRAYLVSSLQRKIIRKLKRLRSQQSKLLQLPEELVSSKEDQIISDQHTLDKQYLIIRAVNSLTKRQKEVIRLRFYSNLCYEEIAGKMNIRTDSIYNLVYRALMRLHKGLSNRRELSLN